MKNWLIKALGGWTDKMVEMLVINYKIRIKKLEADLLKLGEE